MFSCLTYSDAAAAAANFEPSLKLKCSLNRHTLLLPLLLLPLLLLR
jgi:hypothetical protein